MEKRKRQKGERRVFDEKEERKRCGQETIKGKNKCRERDNRKINKKRESEKGSPFPVYSVKTLTETKKTQRSPHNSVKKNVSFES